MFASVLCVTPLISLFVFVSDDSVARLLVEHGEAVSSGVEIESDTPIVLVIFDALPISSLLSLEGTIDRAQYPAFAALVDDSTWFRNTAAVSPWTMSAVPAILTGRLPNLRLDATMADHPRNIFTLLGDHYEMHIEEKYTALYPEPDSSQQEGEEGGGHAPSAFVRAISFLSDLSVLYVHVVLPEDINPLPALDQVWKDFADWKATDPIQMATLQKRDPAKRFHRFIDGIEARPQGGRPTLHFLHVLLPHGPYRYLPSGDTYWPRSDPGLNRSGRPIAWADNEWLTVQAYQRHLLQLQYTDTLLGELLVHLKKIGSYDETLIAVIADHGNAFWPGESMRAPFSTRHPEDVVAIPFFIKAPHQREGRVVTRIVESIDVLATIADVLEIEIPWNLDGCSALRADCPERSRGKMNDLHNGGIFEFDRTLFERRATIERKERLFAEGLYRVGPFPELLESRLRVPGGQQMKGVRAVVGYRSFDLATRFPNLYTVGRISGNLEIAPGGEVPKAVAVAIDSVVQAVVPVVWLKDKWTFNAMLPDGAHPESIDQVQIAGVSGEAGKPETMLIHTILSPRK